MAAQDIVDRLDHCRSSGKDQWMARCPAHQDSSPSLSIKELSDGRVLIHCHAGCSALDVISAVGLEWDSLFPPTDRNYHAERKQYERTVDELVLEIAEADRKAGKTLSREDEEREAEAFARVLLEEPSPNPDDPKELFATYAYNKQKGMERTERKVEIPEDLKNQTVEEWLADYFGEDVA